MSFMSRRAFIPDSHLVHLVSMDIYPPFCSSLINSAFTKSFQAQIMLYRN